MSRNPYCESKRPILTLVERTEPKPGQVILMRHGTYRANDRGGYDYVSGPVAHPNAGPAMPIHAQHAGLGIWIVAGAVSLALFLFGGHGLGWF